MYICDLVQASMTWSNRAPQSSSAIGNSSPALSSLMHQDTGIQQAIPVRETSQDLN